MGGTGDVQKPVKELQGWKYPPPNSVIEIILKSVCAYAKQTVRPPPTGWIVCATDYLDRLHTTHCAAEISAQRMDRLHQVQ